MLNEIRNASTSTLYCFKNAFRYSNNYIFYHYTKLRSCCLYILMYCMTILQTFFIVSCAYIKYTSKQWLPLCTPYSYITHTVYIGSHPGMDALVTGIIYNVMAQTGNTLVNKWMSTHEQMNTYNNILHALWFHMRFYQVISRIWFETSVLRDEWHVLLDI